MIMTAIRRADDHYRLHVAGREVGWVNGHALGFRAFTTRDDAVEGARFAYATLGPWLLRQRRAASPGGRPYLLGLQVQGETTWLTAGEVRIGRVSPWRRHDAAGEDGTEYAFELWLPAGLGPALVLSAARRVHAAASRRAALAPDAGHFPPWPGLPREEPAEAEQWFATSG